MEPPPFAHPDVQELRLRFSVPDDDHHEDEDEDEPEDEDPDYLLQGENNSQSYCNVILALMKFQCAAVSTYLLCFPSDTNTHPTLRCLLFYMVSVQTVWTFCCLVVDFAGKMVKNKAIQAIDQVITYPTYIALAFAIRVLFESGSEEEFKAGIIFAFAGCFLTIFAWGRNYLED